MKKYGRSGKEHKQRPEELTPGFENLESKIEHQQKSRSNKCTGQFKSEYSVLKICKRNKKQMEPVPLVRVVLADYRVWKPGKFIVENPLFRVNLRVLKMIKNIRVALLFKIKMKKRAYRDKRQNHANAFYHIHPHNPIITYNPHHPTHLAVSPPSGYFYSSSMYNFSDSLDISFRSIISFKESSLNCLYSFLFLN